MGVREGASRGRSHRSRRFGSSGGDFEHNPALVYNVMGAAMVQAQHRRDRVISSRSLTASPYEVPPTTPTIGFVRRRARRKNE